MRLIAIIIASLGLHLDAWCQDQPIKVPEQATISSALALIAQDSPLKTVRPSARMNTKPVLTGAEMFSVENFRGFIRELGGNTTGYQTAAQVFVDSNALAPTFGEAGRGVGMMAGWAQLWKNWAFATILGDGRVAASYLVEAYKVDTAMDGDNENDFFPSGYSDLEIQSLTLALSVQLRSAASDLGDDAALIPQSCDPEGYIRQRLQFVYDDLLSAAAAIRDAGHF